MKDTAVMLISLFVNRITRQNCPRREQKIHSYVDIITGLSRKIRLSWRRLTPDSQERNARGDGVRWMVEGEPDFHRFGLFGFLYSVRNGKMHIAYGCRCGGATGVEPQKIFLTPVVQACALLLLISCNLAIIS